MWSITRLRQHPHFAHLFAHVHPLCWLILWWELNRLIGWFLATDQEDVVYATSTRGFITIRYIAPKSDPTLYKPLPRTFRPLSDAGWGSDLPACLSDLAADETLRRLPILPRAAGGGCEGSAIALQSPGAGLRSLWRSRLTEAALTSPLNTS